MKFNINKLLKLKIRSKLVIAFTALSLLPVLIVGSIGITTNIKSLRQISINNLDHDLMEIKKDLDLFFYGIEDKIFFLISSLFILIALYLFSRIKINLITQSRKYFRKSKPSQGKRKFSTK